VKLNEEQGTILISGLGYISSGLYRLELTTESGLVLKSKQTYELQSESPKIVSLWYLLSEDETNQFTYTKQVSFPT
jgi:hypothetical protein